MNKILIFLLSLVIGASTAFASSRAKIGLVQYNADIHFDDVQTNLENLKDLALDTIDQGASIIVFPEGSSFGYATSDELWCLPGMTSFQSRSCRDVSTIAEQVPNGPTTDYWIDFAKQHSVTIFFSLKEQSGEYFYNTQVAVDQDGYIGSYRKQYLYWVDTAYAQPGQDSKVLELGGHKFGIMICMDANYSELYNEYKRQGVENILLVMDWDDDPYGPSAAHSYFRKQAKKNQMNIYASDQSRWDGTGFYPMSGAVRERNGLEAFSVDVDGISIHELN